MARPRVERPTVLDQQIFTVAELARATGFNYDKMRYWMRREGVVTKRAGKLIVTRERLITAFPEVWDAVCRHRMGIEH